jgi:hypothetical protein
LPRRRRGRPAADSRRICSCTCDRLRSLSGGSGEIGLLSNRRQERSDDPSHRLRQYARCGHGVFGLAIHSPIAQSGPPRAIRGPSWTGGSADRAAIDTQPYLCAAWRDTPKHEVSAWISPIASARSRALDKSLGRRAAVAGTRSRHRPPTAAAREASYLLPAADRRKYIDAKYLYLLKI